MPASITSFCSLQQVRPIFKAYCLDCHGGADIELEGEAQACGWPRTARRVAGREGRRPWCRESPRRASCWTGSGTARCRRARRRSRRSRSLSSEQLGSPQGRTLRDEPESLPPGIDITPEERAFWAFQPIRRPRLFRPSSPRIARRAPRPDRRSTPSCWGSCVGAGRRSLAQEADRLTLLRRARAADLTRLAAVARNRSTNSFADRRPDCLRAGDRPPARFAPLRRAAWSAALARRRRLRRLRRRRQRGHAATLCVQVSRLRPSGSAERRRSRLSIVSSSEQLAGDELVSRPWANLKPEQIEPLAATGFLRMAADGTSAGGPDERHGVQPGRRRHARDRRLVALLGLTVGCARVPRPPIRPDPADRLLPPPRAVFEPAASTQCHWRRPSRSLAWSRSTPTPIAARSAADREAEAKQAPRRRLRAQGRQIHDRGPGEGADQVPRGAPRQAPATLPALNTADDKRIPPAQKQLLASHPSVNISEGVLYQYNQAAADDLKKEREKIAAVRAKKPVEEFVSVLDEIPGVVPETKIFHRGDHRQPASPPGHSRRPDHRLARPGRGSRPAARDPRVGRPRAGGWLMRDISSTAVIRSSAASWRTGSGCTTSAGVWSRRPATSARPWGLPPHRTSRAARLAGLRAACGRAGGLKRMHRLRS